MAASQWKVQESNSYPVTDTASQLVFSIHQSPEEVASKTSEGLLSSRADELTSENQGKQAKVSLMSRKCGQIYGGSSGLT